ncbi:MAG: FkbM family methyltransferase, partial [Verrucomicrobiota bacterium]
PSAKRRLAELFARHDAPLLPDPGATLAVYGAGNCGRDALRVLGAEGYKVAAFLDAHAADIGPVGDIPCHAPGSREALDLARAGMPVLVAVFNFTADTGAIEESLRRDGFANVLPYACLDAKFPGRLNSRFWLADRGFWDQHMPDILRGLELWEDDRSREIYVELVELRLTSNLQLLRSPDREHQYFPCDLAPLREPVRLIDAGAFNGDTLSAMRAFEFETVAAFEPDARNFRDLRRWLDSERSGLKDVVLFPCGVDSETAMRRFQPGQGAASAIDAGGGEMIQVVAMDDVLPRFRPTFIKLDIEGAEIAALNGAAGLIRAHCPRIAACAYHLPSHLWEVPLLLKELVPTHKLHLRYHGFNGFDVVAYAVEP